MTTFPPRPALFLDRDGVINRDKGFVHRVEDFEWIDGAIDCVRRFNEMGWYVFIVTNQTGIARNLYTLDDMARVHDWLRQEMTRAGARIDEIYFCPFHEDGENPDFRRASDDRKPSPGMLKRALADHNVDAASSFMIGDKASDLQAAEAAGLPGFLFTGGNLDEFAQWALRLVQSPHSA